MAEQDPFLKNRLSGKRLITKNIFATWYPIFTVTLNFMDL